MATKPRPRCSPVLAFLCKRIITKAADFESQINCLNSQYFFLKYSRIISITILIIRIMSDKTSLPFNIREMDTQNANINLEVEVL